MITFKSVESPIWPVNCDPIGFWFVATWKFISISNSHLSKYSIFLFIVGSGNIDFEKLECDRTTSLAGVVLFYFKGSVATVCHYGCCGTLLFDSKRRRLCLS